MTRALPPSWEKIPYETAEFFPKRTRYCVCVTVMNEGERIKRQLSRMQQSASLADIILADTRSTDGSTGHDLLKSFGVRTLLTLDEKGLSLATMAAFHYAAQQGYEGLVTVDGNGKDGVEALREFVKGLDDGYDLVQGGRFMKGGFHKNTPWDRYVGIRFVMAPMIALRTGTWYSDPTNAFRALSMRFLLDERVQPVRRVFLRFSLQHYLIYRAAGLGFKIKQIPVSRVYPDDGSIPTKIIGWRLKWLDLYELIETLFGKYDPPSP